VECIRKAKIYCAGQRRRINSNNKREFKRRTAAEPMIELLKAEPRMACDHLAYRAGSAVDTMLAASCFGD